MSLSMGLSKHCQNGSAFLLGRLMKSMQQWSINGEVISSDKTNRYTKLYIKGKLSNPAYSTNVKLDCVVPHNVCEQVDTTKPFYAKGRVVFKGNYTYFLAEQIGL